MLAAMGQVVHDSRVELLGEQCVVKIEPKLPELSYKIIRPATR